MANLYEVLGVDPASSYDEIKQSFQKLALQYHPDKASRECDNRSQLDADGERFIAISQAYKVLCNPELRPQYDAALQQRLVAQDWPIQDVISFKELTNDASTATFSYPCRCGSSFVLDDKDVLYQIDHVLCNSCSLCIKVDYS